MLKIISILIVVGTTSFCSVPPSSSKDSESSSQLLLTIASLSSSFQLSTVTCQSISYTNSSDYFFLWIQQDHPMADVECKGEAITKIDSYLFTPALPNGIETRIEGNLLLLTGTPTETKEDAEYTIELFGSEKKEIGRFSIKIDPYENYYILQPNSFVEFPKGVQDSIQIGSSGQGNSVQVSFDPGLPSGISYEPKSGILSGSTNLSLGVYIYMISAWITDAEGTRPDVTDGSFLFLSIVPNRIKYPKSAYYFPTNQNIEVIPEIRSSISATYALENGVVMPSVLTFHSSNGKISGVTPGYEWKSALEVKGTNALGNSYTNIYSFEILSPDKMKCNQTGIASGCSKQAPYSCSATAECFTSYNACKLGVTNSTPCQF